MDIVLTIPDEKISELKLGFLTRCPVPDDGDGPMYTDSEWLKIWIKDAVFEQYKAGKTKLAEVEIDEGVIG